MAHTALGDDVDQPLRRPRVRDPVPRVAVGADRRVRITLRQLHAVDAPGEGLDHAQVAAAARVGNAEPMGR